MLLLYNNSAKCKWIYTDVHNNIKLENVVNGNRYLGVNLVINRKELTKNIDDRIKKFNAAAYDETFY